MKNLKAIFALLCALMGIAAYGMETNKLTLNPNDFKFSEPTVIDIKCDVLHKGNLIGHMNYKDFDQDRFIIDAVFQDSYADKNLKDYCLKLFETQSKNHGFNVTLLAQLQNPLCPRDIQPTDLTLITSRPLTVSHSLLYNNNEIGTIHYSNKHDGSRNLNSIVIREAMRSKGIGSLFIKQFITQSKNEKIRRLDIHKVASKAISFYERLGFVHNASEGSNTTDMTLDLTTVNSQ
jgi:ribosomal protein S18 acetylase RimI-like enzyme